MSRKIFIVDDEANIREIIAKYLEKEGYEVRTFANGEELLKAMEKDEPDMLILDIMMDGIDGLEVCRRIRRDSEVPIIFVSARGDEFDRVLGLELGGDDYLTKPFSPRELTVRVKNIFRRIDKIRPTGKKITIKDLTIFPEEHRVEKNGGEEIDFTNKEYELFMVLAVNKNIAFTREQLLDKVWGYDYYGDIRAVDDLVKRIRKKIKDKGSEVEVTTIWGYGYKIDD